MEDYKSVYSGLEIDTILGQVKDKANKTEVNKTLENKVNKESGKGLSTNDFTNDAVSRLNNIIEKQYNVVITLSEDEGTGDRKYEILIDEVEVENSCTSYIDTLQVIMKYILQRIEDIGELSIQLSDKFNFLCNLTFNIDGNLTEPDFLIYSDYFYYGSLFCTTSLVADGVTTQITIYDNINKCFYGGESNSRGTVTLSRFYFENSENIEALEEKITLATDSLSNKVDKVTGKELSTNDFTNNHKEKLDSLIENKYQVDFTLIEAPSSSSGVQFEISIDGVPLVNTATTYREALKATMLHILAFIEGSDEVDGQNWLSYSHNFLCELQYHNDTNNYLDPDFYLYDYYFNGFLFCTSSTVADSYSAQLTIYDSINKCFFGGGYDDNELSTLTLSRLYFENPETTSKINELQQEINSLKSAIVSLGGNVYNSTTGKLEPIVKI